MNFDYYIGIDQTGAINKNQTPKPLCICIYEPKNKKMKLVKIKKFQKQDIIDSIEKNFDSYSSKSKVLILVDTVFGLPEELAVDYRNIFKKAKNYESKNKNYGSNTAHSFFCSFLGDKNSLSRTAEIKAEAHSVFKKYPFQKNISCGSYRVIKDLSENTNWFSLWPFEKIEKRFVIAESYPTLCWSILLKSKYRKIDFIISEIQNNLKIFDIPPCLDSADATILALTAPKLEKMIFRKVQPIQKKEGWILGVPF